MYHCVKEAARKDAMDKFCRATAAPSTLGMQAQQKALEPSADVDSPPKAATEDARVPCQVHSICTCTYVNVYRYAYIYMYIYIGMCMMPSHVEGKPMGSGSLH